MSKPPIIIIGMHRSGTSFLTRSLQQAGIFMGAKRESNDESTFFLRLNNWLLRQSGGSWHHPDPFDTAMDCTSYKELLIDHIHFRLKDIEAIGYWGLKKPYKEYRGWGWKDPRNTFTLDFWLSMFPDAKIISIRRHGIDVASSLNQRYKKNQKKYNSLPAIKKHLLNRKRALRGYGDSPLSSDLYESFKLWEKYELKVEEHNLTHNILNLTFESFGDDMREQSVKLAEFLDMDNSDELYMLINSSFDKSRVNAWKKQKELVAFSSKVACNLESLGY